VPLSSVEKRRGVPRVTLELGYFRTYPHAADQSTKVEAVTAVVGTVCWRPVAILKNFFNKIIIMYSSHLI